MSPKSPEFKVCVSDIRAQIQTAKRRGTRSGFIDYYGCISVTNDFIDMILAAKKQVAQGNYALAYMVSGLVLINLGKLAIHADDSAGGITNTRDYLDELLELICTQVEIGSEQAECLC